jgi:hypothetical protein
MIHLLAAAVHRHHHRQCYRHHHLMEQIQSPNLLLLQSHRPSISITRVEKKLVISGHYPETLDKRW